MKLTKRQLRGIIREATLTPSGGVFGSLENDELLPFKLQTTPSELKEIFAMIETSQIENVKQAVDLFNMLEGTDVEVWDGERAQEALETSGHSGAFRVDISGGDFVENVNGWTTPRLRNPPEYVHPFLVAVANQGYAIDEDLWGGLNSGWIYL